MSDPNGAPPGAPPGGPPGIPLPPETSAPATGASSLGYAGFGASPGPEPQPPATPPATPPPATPPPATPPPASEPAPAAPWPTATSAPPAGLPDTAAPWPTAAGQPQAPGTPPPAYGAAAPDASPIGYAPYGSFQRADGFAASAQPAAPFQGGPQAMCAIHPETPAVGLCPRCGAYMCQWCQRINDFGEVYCSTCMDRVGCGTPIPWDRRQELGLFQAWWQTFKESAMKPDDFFARAAHGVSTDPPLLFAMICGWLGQLGYSVIRLAMNEQPLMVLISFATVPVGVLLSIYVGGGIAHLFARMFGGTGTYAMTARCWGFCHGPTAMGIVPGLGAMVAGFWSVVLQVYAVKHAHKISGGKAAAAVLLPVGILLVLCCVGAVLVGAAVGAAAAGGRGGF